MRMPAWSHLLEGWMDHRRPIMMTGIGDDEKEEFGHSNDRG